MVHFGPMQSVVVLFWTALAAVLLLLAARAVAAAVRRRKRRVALATVSPPRRPGLSPDEVAAVRADAERAARHCWQEGVLDRRPANPHHPGAPAHVLWYVSYELSVLDLADASAEGKGESAFGAVGPAAAHRT